MLHHGAAMRGRFEFGVADNFTQQFGETDLFAGRIDGARLKA
ncbi:hypothetical protein ACHMW6_15160 [Pseudoduganella sp. UC29_106]